jgi:hypothetical protein
MDTAVLAAVSTTIIVFVAVTYVVSKVRSMCRRRIVSRVVEQ